MFLRAKVHFFSEKPKLSDENCKNYQELSRIIDLSIWQTSDKRIVVSATGIEGIKGRFCDHFSFVHNFCITP